MNQRGQYGNSRFDEPVDKSKIEDPGVLFFKNALPKVLVGVGLMGFAVVAIMKHGTT